MKTTMLFGFLMALFCACGDQKIAVPDRADLTTGNAFIRQLFLFQEMAAPDSVVSGESVMAGALYLTEKGNLIVHTIDEKSDTQSYFWGKYRLTDTSLTYHLTYEYYYTGKWDARWDQEDVDYSKGQSRKVQAVEVTLQRIPGDSLLFFQPNTPEERAIAAKRYRNIVPRGLDYWPYYETEGMKFYSWLFQQIPALAAL